jgi:tRNA (adenine-N(1)-)-methyltransferase non-catalytic subunit
MAPIIGTPFGSVFRLQNRAAGGGSGGGAGGGPRSKAPKPCLVRVPRHASVMGGEGWAAQAAEEAAADAAAAAAAAAAAGNGANAGDASAAATLCVALETRNNARLFDLGTQNQALTASDVHELKRNAKEGGEVIAALCAASATFESKTAFAQAKYKRRKAKKHAAELCVRRPSGRALAHAMFDARGPGKMLNLRPDAVAIALSMANVGANARILVIEAPALAGVLAACAAERLGGHGLVCAASLFAGQRGGPLDAVRHMNFSASERAAVCSATLEELQAAQRATGAAAVVVEGEEAGAGATAAEAEAAPRYAPKAERLRLLLRAGFTGAILADPRADTLELLDAALPLLPPSTPFCLFHQSAQPLAEAQHALASSRRAVMMRLCESWTRPYQVLPGRTHPHMACNGTGGYLLSGVTASTKSVGAGMGVAGAKAGAAAAGPSAPAKNV